MIKDGINNRRLLLMKFVTQKYIRFKNLLKKTKNKIKDIPKDN